MQLDKFLILIPIISLICYCVLLIILLGSKKNKIATYYIYYIICMIIWSFGSVIMRTNFPPSAIFWNHILCIGLISAPVIFYHFTLILTDTTSKLKRLYFAYFSVGILIVCDFTGLIIKEVYTRDNMIYYKLGPIAPIIAIWSLCYLILSFINIMENVKSNKIPFTRVKLVLYGLTLVIIGAISDLFPILGRYPIDIISNTINAVFIVYSIYRYRFLEIKLIMKKGIAYSVYTILLTGFYIIAIILVQQILSKLIGYTTIISTLVLAVLLAYIFQPIRDIIQHWIDKLFYREKLNHQILLRDFSKIINNILDLNELTNSLLGAIKEGIKPKKVYLLLGNDKEEYSLFQPSLQKKYINEIRYGYNHPIVQWFKQGKTLLTIKDIETSSFFTSLWTMEKKQLYELETEIILPIKLREQLIGLIILSERNGGESYSQEEMDLLFTLINNAAVVIENAKMYEDAKYQATTDELTKLYNHRYFLEIIELYIHENSFNEDNTARIKKCAVFYIDFDNFKLVNDTLGHSYGDKFLKAIGQELKSLLKDGDELARFGGDEFNILQKDINDVVEVKELADLILKKFNKPWIVENYEFDITASIGIILYPDDAQNVEDLFKKADIEMNKSKSAGKNQYRFFEGYMNDELEYKISLQKKLKIAVKNNDFIVYYQPQINIKTGKISGMEALVRWVNTEEKVIQPNEFIPLAEETGFILSIGENVLRTACMKTKQWNSSGNSKLSISVNVSVIQLNQINFVDVIKNILAVTELEPQYLTLEITESVLIKALEFNIRKLEQLRTLGIKISLDDFGTGYSSLSYIVNLPIDILKIDKSFVDDVTVNSKKESIIESIIALAQKINIEVVAEGVEDKQQYDVLKKQNCDKIQGYYFSKPLSEEDFEKFIKE